jgi:hypothetical protein
VQAGDSVSVQTEATNTLQQQNNHHLHSLSQYSDYRNTYYNDFIRRSLSAPNGTCDNGLVSPGAASHTTTTSDAAPLTPTDNGAGSSSEESAKAAATGQKRRWRHKKYYVPRGTRNTTSREEWWFTPKQGEPPLKVTVTDVTCNCQRVTFMESTTDEGFFRTRTDP